MKTKCWVAFSVLIISCANFQLCAQSTNESFEAAKAKAEGGNATAQATLGSYYLAGNRVKQDYAEAVKWFRKSADQGNAIAQNGLGACYYTGVGVSRDYSEAVKWYRKATDQGYGGAQFNLGICYENGLGVTQDYVEAVKWYRKAADQGYADAQYNLGFCYEKGLGLTRDYVEAVKWYRSAADQGHADAQMNLGSLYQNGRGVAQDGTVALKWFQKAADQGHGGSEYNLGVMYQSGQGVPQDFVEALKWYRQAAGQGYADAQCNLGLMYQKGQGVPQDYIEALKWYRLAAEQGVDYAQNNLGVMYEKGEGVVQDYVQAYKWFNIASSSVLPSDPQASSFALRRDAIAQRMTPLQIAEGQRLAREFIPRKESPGSQSASTTADFPSATGTGFFITGDGYLISNYHVIKNATKIHFHTHSGLIDATMVKVDPANDLALLKAVGRFAPLPIATSRTVKLRGSVATVGFPDIGLQGFAPKLAKGEIASLAGAGDDPRYFQISVPVQPGNSGGALVDARGNVVGIVAAKLDASAALAASGALPENVNYAVKSSLLLSFLESVPDLSSELKEPNTKDEPFEDVVKSAQDAAVLVLVY